MLPPLLRTLIPGCLVLSLNSHAAPPVFADNSADFSDQTPAKVTLGPRSIAQGLLANRLCLDAKGHAYNLWDTVHVNGTELRCTPIEHFIDNEPVRVGAGWAPLR